MFAILLKKIDGKNYMCHTGIYAQGSHPCIYPEWNMKFNIVIGETFGSQECVLVSSAI
jgi:hypothetical protein